ncbi:unnamed protein product [Bemisia tabaci]|uniref:Uncharacterized protein n=1 Tax=Bemisia tabaci TaxID=7038 RepID=A0A9P0G5I4_BEMTA|nr:unnamed protein product [Bemisia tabaci]
MTLALLRQAWHSNAKSVPQHYFRVSGWSVATRNHPRHSQLHQHLPLKGPSANFNQGFYRCFMSHDGTTVVKQSRNMALRDGVPKTYELIYALPMEKTIIAVQFAVIGITCAGCFLLYKFYTTDGIRDVQIGAFDDDQLRSLRMSDAKPLLTLGGVTLAMLYLLIRRFPIRIYRSNEASDPRYIATFINQFLPWKKSNYEFVSARKTKLDFIARYIFQFETYWLGRKQAILFPTSFKTPQDYEELIEPQSGNVKKEVETNRTVGKK